ncbi:hypothetical protein Scep_024662 [Stephania cephalantha]|uniref:non-specific serine/threonine protein kinase n=1 Tax=Stephania cephalantha TaxID=152367 RepID=A0AAP0HXC0_9MAGN
MEQLMPPPRPPTSARVIGCHILFNVNSVKKSQSTFPLSVITSPTSPTTNQPKKQGKKTEQKKQGKTEAMTFTASSSVSSLFAVFVLLVLLLCELSGYAAAADIALGSFLQPSPAANWSSPNNTFSLSFLPTPTPNPAPAFTAAISFSGIPVWKAGGDSALVDSNGRLRLLPDGDLRLLNGSGATVWSSNTSNRGVSSASLDDSGNLRLLNGTLTVWSSFANPTDTILPSQNFSTDNLLQSGPYSFALLNSGQLRI